MKFWGEIKEEKEIVEKRKKEYIKKENHFLLNDLLQIHHALQREQMNVEEGNLFTIKLLIMKRTLFEFWIILLFILPYVALFKYIYNIEISFFMANFIFFSLVGLLAYFNFEAIGKVQKDSYLEKLSYLEDKVNQEMGLIEFDRENVFSLTDINETVLIDPQISIVILEKLRNVVDFKKLEIFKYTLSLILFYVFLGLGLWVAVIF